MRPYIPPKAIQTHLTRGSPGPRRFKHSARYPERRIRRHDLHTGHPLRDLATLGGSYVALRRMIIVDGSNLEAGDVSEGLGGAEMREKGTVTLEYVRFFGAGGNRVRGVGPGTGVFARVVGGEVEGAQGDTDVKV